MKGYQPSRVTIIAVCCAVATIAIIAFLLLTILQPGTDNYKKASAGVATAGTSPHPTDTSISTIVGASTVAATATAPITKGTSIPATSTPSATYASNPTNTPTANPTRDPDPASFTISVNGGGDLPFNGTVGKQDTQPQNVEIYYPDPNSNLPPKSPPPGPITWSISATPQDNPIGNWLTFSPTGGIIQYGSHKTITVTASILPNMMAKTYTMKVQVTPHQTLNYAIATLTLSAPTPDPDPTSFTISVKGGGQLDFTGTVGQQGTQPSEYSITVDYPDPNLPPKSPPPGPITWSISATPKDNPVGNWLTFSTTGGTIHYGDPEQSFIVTASILPSMQANITYTMKILATPNQTLNYGIITLTLSAPTSTSTLGNNATVQMIALLPFTSSFFFYGVTTMRCRKRKLGIANQIK